MAAATVTFTPEAGIPGTEQSLGSLKALVGKLHFVGDYVAGGIALDLGERMKRTGMGKVFAISSVRGYDLEYDATNKKVILWKTAGVEHDAVTLDTDLTGTDPYVVIIGR